MAIKNAMERYESENIYSLIERNATKIIISAILFALFYLFLHIATKKIRAKRKLSKLIKTKDSLEQEIKNLQKRYFEKKEISKSDYQMLIERYQKNLDVIKRKILMQKKILK